MNEYSEGKLGSEAREVHDCGNLRTIHYFVDRSKNGEDDI